MSYVLINGEPSCVSPLTSMCGTRCSYKDEAEARADFERAGWFAANPKATWTVVEGSCPEYGWNSFDDEETMTCPIKVWQVKVYDAPGSAPKLHHFKRQNDVEISIGATWDDSFDEVIKTVTDTNSIIVYRKADGSLLCEASEIEFDLLDYPIQF